MIYDFDPVYEHTTTAELQLELSDLKTRLELQEAETQKANWKFEFRLGEAEKLRTGFEAKKSALAEEKTVLTQRAEKAEAALEESTTELTGLKRQVSQMVSAIFGKSPDDCQILYILLDDIIYS